MTTLADKSLLSGGDNKPPMLEKHLYDSWKSRMELYMMNRPHGRMILAFVEKGPLVWPTITVDGPGYWDKNQTCFTARTSLTKQERECKLYDEFDKFTYKKGESLHEYYLRFTLLLNDMNIYKMPLEQFQGRQISYAAGTTRTFTPGASGSNLGKQRIVTYYNCKGKGHMSKQFTKPRRKRDDSWFKEKVLLVQAQASGQILHEEELAFLADPRIPEAHQNSTNVQSLLLKRIFISLCSDALAENSNSSTQQDALILSVIEQLKTQVANCTKINLENKSVNDTLTAELERYKEQVKVLNEGQNVDLKNNDNVLDSCAQSVEIDLLKQTLSEHLKEKEIF
ncbi:hypothetical protein Tco_1540879 [Tanacetum coccineum]